MSRIRRASPAAAYAAAAALLLLGGCASGGGNALDQMRSDAVRHLTVQCYWEHDGHRLIYGGYEVHAACRRWARERVRVRFPGRDGWQ